MPEDRLACGAKRPLKIVDWVADGEIDGREVKTTNDLYDWACGALDGVNAADILGGNLFVGEDGEFYTVTVEACIGVAGTGFARDVINGVLDGEEGTDPDAKRIKVLEGYLEKLADREVRGRRTGKKK